MAYNIERLEQGLVNADKAGDIDAAKAFASEIRKMRQTQETPASHEPALSDAFSKASTQREAIKPVGFGEAIGREIRDIPRQAGLIARNAIEGVGGVADLVTSPIRGVINAADNAVRGSTIPEILNPTRELIGGESGESLSNFLGLPKPSNSQERVVGEIEKFIASGGGVIGGAKKLASVTPGIVNKIATSLAQNPGSQLISAGGAGAASGSVKEADGGGLAQLGAGLIGGVASPIAAAKSLGFTKTLANAFSKGPKSSANIDAIIENSIKPQGLTINDIDTSVRDALRNDIKQAIKGGEVSPDVVRRLYDYRTTGLTPTAGPLTLDPGTVTRQKNLSALGASSTDPNLQALSQIENSNARKLIDNINALGADTADDALTAGQKISGAITAKNAAEQAKISELYKTARDSTGRSGLLDGKAFAKNVEEQAKKGLYRDAIPPDIKSALSDIKNGDDILTVDRAEEIKTAIGNLQRNTNERSVKFALGKVRDALENTPLISKSGEKAIKAFGSARSANREFMKIVDDTPALQAIRDGVEPDKFVQNFITGSGNSASFKSVSNLRELVKDSPEALLAIKNNIAQSLKNAALGGKPDELAKFSSTGFNRKLSSISDNKLKLFFSPEELKALKAIGRVSGYEQFQPTGSAVNNSKTAAALVASVLDRIGGNPIVSKLSIGSAGPIARLLSNPIREASNSVEAGRLTKIPNTIASKGKKQPSNLPNAALYSLINDNNSVNEQEQAELIRRAIKESKQGANQ